MAAYVKRTQRRMGDVNKPLIIVYDALLSDSKIPVRGSKDGKKSGEDMVYLCQLSTGTLKKRSKK